jgi:hypothetical protein
LIDDMDGFRRRLGAALAAKPAEALIGRICAGFDALALDSAALEVALCPLQSDRITTVNSSVVRILLSFTPLQRRMLDVLMAQVIAIASSSSTPPSSAPVMDRSRRLLQLIVSHLQWLPVRDSESFARSVLEMADSMPAGDHKRELVLALPTIVEERHHSMVAAKLREMMMTSEFPADALEAISHLTLSQELVAEVTRLALGRIASARPADLPAVLGYVLGSVVAPECSSPLAKETAEKIRAINLESISSARQARRGDPSEVLDERRLVEVL